LLQQSVLSVVATQMNIRPSCP